MKRLIFLILLFSGIYANANSVITNTVSSIQISNTISIDTKPSETVIKPENKHFNKLINLLSIAIVAILSLLSLSLYKNNIIEYKSNNLLKEKNKELEIEKERSEKAIKAKSDFLATISHELRTPLNAINIISEILMNENPKESQVENLISLKISTNHLMNLINDVLQINKIESPNFKTEEIEFSIQKKIENIDKSLAEIAKLNDVKCLTFIDESIPKIVIGDPIKLTQILINLISNAIKFSSNGIVTTNVKLIAKTSQNVTIKFEVIDNGIGIPKDQQELIFEDFTQGSSEISRKFGGTGLGLSIVKKLLEHLGGTIQLESEENVGSNFNFQLTFKTDKNYIESTENLDYFALEDKKILLVEDNSITQLITQKLIEKYNANCTIASTGNEALKLYEQSSFDLIIMDINLPDINGDKVAEEIRKLNTTIPILAFTAIHSEDYIKKLTSKGMNDYITKPIDSKLFYDKIINLLKLDN
jgi:signal transduction histidine kinase/CheY-like chemotaxis protein